MKIVFAGQAMELHPSGALWIPELRLLCAADIHLEKGSFFRRFGSLLPPYDTEENLEKLAQVLGHFRPDVFIALGDSFHDAQAVARMETGAKETLNRLVRSVGRWLWITGNHDPEIGAEIAGGRAENHSRGLLRFEHILTQLAQPEISGHYHPKAKVNILGHSLSAPCFVQSGDRLILPAFGSYTGGLDINSADFLDIMPLHERLIYMTHRDKVYAL